MAEIPENTMKKHGISKFVKIEIKEKSGNVKIKLIRDEDLVQFARK